MDKLAHEIEEKSEEYKEARVEKETQKEYDSLNSDEYAEVRADLYSEASGPAKGINAAIAWIKGEDASTRWARKHQDEMDARVHRKANDKRLEAKEEKDKQVKEATKNAIKFLPLIIIVIVIALLVLLFWFLSKRSVSKPVRVKTNTARPSPQAEMNSTSQANVRYKRVLKENCHKLGLNYDDVLSKYNGDLVTAVNETNLQLYR